MKVSVIIVNHNTARVLSECVRSVYVFEDPAQFEIIIVDNASADNSSEIIEKLSADLPGIKKIHLNELKSFSYANNCGAETAAGEFLLIMNPDIVFTESLFAKLTGVLNSDKSIGAISPALVGTNGNFQRNYFQRYPSLRQFIYYYSFLAGIFNRSARRMNRYLENQDIDIDSGEIYFTEQIPCAFFLIPAKLYRSAGKLDDKFTLFFEDVDICYRLNKTHKLAVDTSLKVTHLGGSSFKTPDNWKLHGLFIKSMVLFFRKHYSPLRAFTLGALVRINSFLVLIYEGVKSLFGKGDKYRKQKHRYLLSLLGEDK